MRFSRMVTTVDAHAAGEPMRVMLSGVPTVHGKTMFDRMEYVKANLDHLRGFLLNGPRGHKSMPGAIITGPTREDADVGVIFLGLGGHYLPMCGHGTIAVCTVLVETGLVEAQEPETTVVLDTPGGLVRAKIAVDGASAKLVTFENVPSFVYELDVGVDVPGIGQIDVDIAYGGNFFAILPAESVGLTVAPTEVARIVSVGRRILDAVNATVVVRHPQNPDIEGVISVQFSTEPTHPEATLKNVVYDPPGEVDRSPCGTGTSAKVAVLHARGELAVGERFVYESIIGSLFYAQVIGETQVGPYPAVIPSVGGHAYVTGIHQFVLDVDDPFPAGFVL